jgi:membrane-associated protein
MDKLGRRRETGWSRLLAWGLIVGLMLCWVGPVLAGSEPSLESGTPAAAEDENFFVQVFNNLFNSRGLMNVLKQPQYTLLAFVALNLIVFVETGLLVGFCLPGDSLLVTAGLVCAGSEWSLPLLLITLSLAAIVGDSVGYTIGFKTGPKIFCRENSLFFHKDHLLKAQQFYERHGGKTIILARFMPIIRTFAPVVAGVGRMEYRKFLFFNVFGGIGWVTSMVLAGYYLPAVVNPVLRPLFGPTFEVQDHIEKVIILVVLLSISPGIFLWLRNKLKVKLPPEPQLAEAMPRGK